MFIRRSVLQSPHESGHGICVLDLGLIPSEDVSPRCVLVCKPISIELHVVPTPAGVKDLREISGGEGKTNNMTGP
jgi:hypothetical protein